MYLSLVCCQCVSQSRIAINERRGDRGEERERERERKKEREIEREV